MTGTPNQLCACGCGREVSRPYHRFYYGCGSKRAMSSMERLQVIDLYKYGFSQREISEFYGCSQATISNWTGMRQRIQEKSEPLIDIPRTECRPQQVVRKEYWESEQIRIKEKKEWQRQWVPAKKALAAAKAHLNRNR